MKKNIYWIITLAFLYFAVPFGLRNEQYALSILIEALTIGGVALAWAMLGNLGGMVSFGHSAFIGVGAYTSAIVSLQLGLPVLLGMLFGGFASACAGAVMLPVLRLKGPYFALAILAYSQIFRVLAIQLDGLTGGAGGMPSVARLPVVLGFDFSTKTGSYICILSIVLAFMLAYHLIFRSIYGLALRAMHGSEDATRVVGVNSMLLKGAILLLSAFMTGVIGSFNAHYLNFVEPDYTFGGQWVIVPIIAAIFGGYRTVSGPVFGAIVVYFADQMIFKAIFPVGHQFILGGLLVLVIILTPRGLLPLLAQRLKGRKHVKG